MNNKGSCLTFNSLINLFPKVKDVLHCDFLIRHLHTLDFFFPFAFLRKPFYFPFHLINYLPILTLMPASVWWGLGDGAWVWKIGEQLQIFLHYSILEEKQCRKIEKKKGNTVIFE